MIYDGCVFSILIATHWIYYVPKYCVGVPLDNICIRNEEEIKKKFNSMANIDLHRHLEYCDTHFLEMIARSSAFVDKTLLIRRILETKEKIVLITYPPGTGKTMNLEMLKSFFEIRAKRTTSAFDQTVKIMPQELSSTYKFFTTGVLDTSNDAPFQSNGYVGHAKCPYPTPKATYTRPPMILKYITFIRKHLGVYPVISMRFRSPYFRVKNITSSLTEYICDVFKQHVFLKGIVRTLIKSKTTTKADKKRAREVMETLNYYNGHCHYGGNDLETWDVENSMQILSQILYEFLGRQVIVLIDDYIETLRYYLSESDYCLPLGQYKKDLQSGLQVLRNFFEATFRSPHVKKVILTGVLSINNKDLFPNSTEYVHYNAIDNDLQQFYGITENEMEILFQHYVMLSKMQKDVQFYKGSVMKSNTSFTIYNTWSIVNFLKEKKIDQYFIKYKNIFKRVSNLLDMKILSGVLKPLFGGGKKLIRFVDSQMNFYMEKLNLDTTVLPSGVLNRSIETEIQIKKSSLWENSTYTEEDINRILSWMCEMGYLSISEIVSRNRQNGTSIYVQFFNEETKQAFQKLSVF